LARPFRYTFILVLVAVSTAMAAVGGWRFARASAPVSGPIILVSIDALRADRLRAYGGTSALTPAMDTLATDGVVFERAYSPSPQTLPAHASMLTGRLPFRTGVRDSVGVALPSREETIAEVLRGRGYDTAAIVSSYALRQETGIDQGFAFFDDNLTEDPSMAVGPLVRDGTEAQQIAEHWLETARTDRAFLFLHLHGAHRPYRSLDVDRSRAGRYDNAVAYADGAIGGLIQYLKSHQLYDQSTIILTSDHGEGLGDHGEQGHGLLLYEEAVRVPLIIKPAAGEGHVRRVPDLVQLVDLVPTIADFARAPLPDDLDGESLAPLLEGERERPSPRLVYAESLFGHSRFGWSPMASVTDGRFRYIRTSSDELYDLEADPQEQVNLVAERPDQAARLRSALDALDRGRAIPPSLPLETATAAEAFDQAGNDARHRLEALGYIAPTWRAPAPEDGILPDPKDKVAVLESYREAVDLAAGRQWFGAIDVLQATLRDDPANADLWRRLAAAASLAGRHDRAVEAWRRVVALDPDDLGAPLAAAAALLQIARLSEARGQAEAVLASAREQDVEAKTRAHELLARIALARRDPDTARSHADAGLSLTPGRPLPDYVEGRLLFDRKQYADALSHFERAIAALSDPAARSVADLHLSTAETLVHLERHDEAELEFLHELARFPYSMRARMGLATLYHATGRAGDAAGVITDLLLLHPTPDGYRAAVQLWTAFGQPKQAAAVRAEAARVFPTPRASASTIRR
jgi:arylsulfatase A-like enzyme/Tfp pilus assembly protein PilF